MINKLASRCVDINSAFCPCFLSDINHCVFCSHLKGELVCDCNWTGTCILYEKQWQSKKHESNTKPVRTELECQLDVKKEVGIHTYYLEFSVTSELAASLDKAGSFIFMRRPEDPDYFHFPVGVMGVNRNVIQVIIEAVGPKSVRLLDGDNNKVLVKGPYFNGIFGQPWIDNTRDAKVILVAGGMGQPPALPAAKRLMANGNKVTAIVAPGKVGRIMIEPNLVEMGITVHTVPSLRQVGMPMLKQLLANPNACPDLVVSAGSDDQHYGVIAAMQAVDVNIPMAATNNTTMCCGEGICGSCTKTTKDNKLVKTCKVQTNFTEFVYD